MELNRLTITDAIHGIRKKEFSVRELISSCHKEIEEKNTTLNAYLDVFDDVYQKADEADQMLAELTHEEVKNLPSLFGIPLAIKDIIAIEGKRMTAASKVLEHYTAPYDATVITKLKRQGAIFMGKTNLDEFAMGASTENSAFGPTRNPYDETRVPGGSSGGSAAAVAAHMALGALGSDTGGSVRQPAAFCGIVGLKPTYGSVSRHGLIAMAASFNQIGPMARTVADTRILFETIVGEDIFDAVSMRTTENRKSKIENSKGIRVGVPKEYFGKGLDHDIEKVIRAAIKKMEGAGASIQEITMPHAAYALPAYYILVPSEVSTDMARFDGIRYGLSIRDSDTLFETYAYTRSRGFGAEVKRRIMLGTYALSAGYYDAYYLKAQKVRALIRSDFERAYKNVDVIVGPTTPTPAFRLGERFQDPLAMYLADMYTVAANCAGIPAISIPAGFVERGGTELPIGIQLMGRWFEENQLFTVAETIEQILKN